MPFRIALSGLNAASNDLKVTGNNIANASTVGFKQSQAEFADIFAQTFGGISRTAIGSGVRTAAVNQNFGQGNIDFTGNGLDLAINGNGFLVFQEPGGQRVYSRAGALEVDRDGYVVNMQGNRLQRFPAEGTGGQIDDLRLRFTESAPKATGEMEVILNLRSDAKEDDNEPFDTTDADTLLGSLADADYSTSLSVYDSLGQPHTATIYFEKMNDEHRGWGVHVVVGDQVADPVDVNSYALKFGADGKLIGLNENHGAADFSDDDLFNGNTAVNFGPYNMGNGSEELQFEIDFSQITQYGAAYAVNSLSQDGYSTGRLADLDISGNGLVTARYTNGQAESLGKIAMANFSNPQGLQQLGDNVWGATFAAGDEQLGEAGSGVFGAIQAGGLEGSNVDVAEQLVNLITAQRNFQANSQVIKTADTITQTIINIR